jgi:hypothetical protein
MDARMGTARKFLPETSDLASCMANRNVPTLFGIGCPQGFQGPWKAALTSGSLSATGDLLAQLVQGQIAKVIVAKRFSTS